MRQQSAQEIFLESDFSGTNAHDYEPFHQGCIDVKLPAPNSDIRFFIFSPADYPYLWVKYLEGLQREYGRIGVDHILDMHVLQNPDSSPMTILAIIDGEIVSGMRFHGPILKAREASVYNEMADGDQALLEEYLNEWIPEKVVEGKGLWLNTKHPARKRILQSMARSSVYGAALLGARYIPGTSPTNIMKIHVDIGMQEMTEIGCVPYPNDSFKTTFGIYDLNEVFSRCTEQNRVLLRRDWQQIQKTRLNTEQQRNHENTWLPIVLDEANPFHAQALESLLTGSDYEQRSHFGGMQNELSELKPAPSESLKQESKRWVAYPWRKVAIELLGPHSFRRLLRDRNRNKITDVEQEKMAALSVGVIGLSTGHVIAHTMVMEGVCGRIKLADFDTLEVSNLNRIPASLLDIGSNKAVIAARRIAELDPYLPVEVFDQGLQTQNIDRFMNGLDIIIEECDSLDVKVIVREEAIKRKIPVLMSTSDLGMMDVERFDLDSDPKPFHGLADVKAADLKDLSRRDKSGYALAIVEGEKISARLAASMVEIDHTVSTWAQLASDVTQGAALVTTAVRRIGCEKPLPSSRTRMNMDEVFEAGQQPVKTESNIKSESRPLFEGSLEKDMLLAASYAPSLGNMQPWKLNWSKDKFCIKRDQSLSSSIDIQGRATLVGLGAASLNAEVVAAHYAQTLAIEHFPLKSDPELVTRFTPNKKATYNESLVGFYEHLLTRNTNRLLGEQKPLSAEVMSQLSGITKHYPVRLRMLSKPESLVGYAELMAKSDRLRYLDPVLHREMMSEYQQASAKEAVREGIDVLTLGLADNDLHSLSLLKRPDVMQEIAHWDGGAALGDYNKSRIANASAVVLLTVKNDTEFDYLVGGKAMQHFWLLAEHHEIAVQPIIPAFLYANDVADLKSLVEPQYQDEITELKADFNELFNLRGNEYPVVVLRLCFSPKPTLKSLRRYE